MGFGAAITSCFSKYVQFSGRAPRSEYWYWVLFVFLGGVVLGAIDGLLFDEEDAFLGGLFSLVTLLPGLAVTARRLHDLGRTGWLMLVWFIPILGWILLIVWFTTRGDAGPNRFGEDPLPGPVPA